jgi:CRISPR-associated endonuclease Cas1
MHHESTQSPEPASSQQRTCLEDIECAVCGTTFHPRNHTRRVCSRPCYHVWWKVEVKDQALANANEKKQELADQGHAQPRQRSYWHSDNPGPRSKQRRREGELSALQVAEDDDDDAAWAERAEYWQGQKSKPETTDEPFNARKIEQPPLVLTGHGVRLRVHQGTLLVRNGFTHFPQKPEELRFFPGDAKLPPRIIVLDCDGSVSFDVLAWLSRHNIPLVQINWRGEVTSVVGNYGVPFDPALRQAQLDALTNGVGLELATQLIRDKIAGCQDTLLTFWRSPAGDQGLAKLERTLDELKETPPSIDALRLIEARAALAYFLCWREVPIQWKGIGRKPIPEEWHRCGMRQGILRDGTNRHATHPVNAMLNYAYASLESHVRTMVATTGLDPRFGFLHSSQAGRDALVYDLMEPLRPKADGLVINFVREHTMVPTDFVVTPTGVCRLHSQLAPRVAHLVPSSEACQSLIRTVAIHLGNGHASVVKRMHTGSGVVRSGRPSRHMVRRASP